MASSWTSAIAVGWLNRLVLTPIWAEPKAFHPRPSGSEKVIAVRCPSTTSRVK